MGKIKENFIKELNIASNEFKDAIKELFSKKGYRQIPNLLTASRGFAPIVVLPLVASGNIVGALIAEIGFALTDCFDGTIARKFNFISSFGKKLDTVCDKIFAITLMIPIISLIPESLIIVLGEVFIGSVNSISFLKGNNVNSSIIGKTKTALLSVTIITSYISMLTGMPLDIVRLLFAITSITQGGAAIDYLLKAIRNNHGIVNIESSKDEKQEEDNKNEDKEININEKVLEPTIHYENNFPKDDFEPKIRHFRR